MLLYDSFSKILFLMQIVQMNIRLDRLSALLEGVAPVFSVIETMAQWGVSELTAPQFDPSLVMVIHPLETEHESHPHQPTPARPSLWIGHLSHWAALNAKQLAKTRTQICIRAQLTGPLGPLLMEEFAQPTDLLTDTHETALSVPMTLIQQEVSHPRCRQPALLKSAGDILFIGILRHLVANPNPDRPGLLHALSDVRIAKALVAMHQSPHFNWNLSALALEAGMSRTSFAMASFAMAFKKAMDKTPGKYLVTLRLALARRALESGKTVKEAARISGYRNPASIARALKSNVAQKR